METKAEWAPGTLVASHVLASGLTFELRQSSNGCLTVIYRRANGSIVRWSLFEHWARSAPPELAALVEASAG